MKNFNKNNKFFKIISQLILDIADYQHMDTIDQFNETQLKVLIKKAEKAGPEHNKVNFILQYDQKKKI